MIVPYRRRLLALLAVLGVIALPPLALRVACLGSSCGQSAESTRVPFCSLPATLRGKIAAGYREGRSPEVLAVPRSPEVQGWGMVGAPPATRTIWPSTEGGSIDAVPLAFSGAGVNDNARIPAGTPLSSVAPTIFKILNREWKFPRVHEGSPIPGVAGSGTPRLVVLVALKGVGASVAEKIRGPGTELRRLTTGSGTWTPDAVAGALPLDPTATMTTIGTGGLPAQHGITGTYLRNSETGRLTRAWADKAPLSIIAGVGDDLDRGSGERAAIGLVGTDPADLGLVGGTWYPDADRDERAIVPPTRVSEGATRMLARGFGTDEIPDLLGVAMEGSFAEMDRQLRTIVDAARRVSAGRVTVVVAGTGKAASATDSTPVSRVVGPVEGAVPGASRVVEAAVPGGLFLDQKTLSTAKVSSSTAVDALLAETGVDGTPRFADAFAGFAVQFGRYC